MEQELAKLIAGSDTVLKDVAAYVAQHPQYQQIIQVLGEKVVQALLVSGGIRCVQCVAGSSGAVSSWGRCS